MKTIGILFGMENTFPGALADCINGMGVEGVHAEPVKIGGIRDDRPAPYDVIVDRISHRMPYYRSWLKHAALNGSIVINDPFLCSADDKFIDVTIARRAGAAVPRTVLIPSKEHPPETTAMSMRNLLYPLNWDELFSYVGFPLFMKPHSGGGWRQVYKIHTPEEFFFYYDQSGPICMMIQEAIHHEAYYRCFCIGRRDVRIMPFAPQQPIHLRYITEYPDVPPSVLDRMRKDVLAINGILGY
ncbi:MAG: hypothetical protein QHI48_04190, partial [Bacteroidota bacterium]|nr:hypothetical protein [Bacteroidota bacterium]